ncbi:MAG: PAS domain S-box protein [Caulobacteraceae bacterium]|nr:PAS domain S-box protein [Caulobacteraceae bacterium]
MGTTSLSDFTAHSAADAGFPRGAGEMAARIRAFDWGATPLGPIDGWPQSLKTVVGMLTAAPNPMVLLWGPEGVLIYNDGYARFAGQRHPELLGMGAREGWPEIADFNDGNIRRGLAGESWSLKDQELVLDRRGVPESAWLDLDYGPVPDESGHPAGVMVFVTETTDRVLADRAKSEVNERLDLALSAGRGVGTWDWDIVADRVVADARFAELYGVDPDQAERGAPIADFFTAIHPDDAVRVGQAIQETLDTGSTFRSEYRLVLPDGSIRWVAAEGRVIRGDNGKPVRLPGVSFDITDRRATDEALHESGRRLQLALDAADLGAFVWHPREDRSEADPRMMAMFGLAPDNDLTLTGALERSIHSEDAAPYAAAVQRALDPRGDGRLHYDLHVVWPDRSEHVVRITSQVHFVGGVPVTMTGTAQDVTEARAQEEALRRTEAHLRFLDSLSTTAQGAVDAAEILSIITRLTAEHMGASVVAYADMDEDQNGFTIRGDWAAPGSTSIVGHYDLAAFGKLAVQELGAGRPLIVNDNLKELAPEEAATFQGIGIAATVCMPLLKEGRLIALMAVHHAAPHVWTEEELTTIREVVTRSWAHVERVRAEAERRESESRYRTLFDTMDEGFCVIEFFDGPHGPDSDYIHVEANPAYAANAGIENVVGQTLREMVGDEAQSWVDRYGEVLRTGKPIRFEQELVATGRWLELSAFRIEPPERKQVAVLFQDLTARKTAEIALRELNADLEKQVAERVLERGTTWEVASDMLSVIDLTTGRFVRVNPAWQVGLGWDRQTLEGAAYADFVHPEDLGGSAEAFEAVRRGDPVLKFENRYRNAEGVWRWLSWTAVPESGKLYSSARDVTAEKEQAAALLQTQEALRQSQKMEAVGQLTGGIAHDFNNLLAGISGSLELLGKRLGEGRLNGMERYIDAAQGSAQRAASLTQRLLAFSRRQTLDPKPTDVNRLISGMEDLIRRTVGPDVEVEVVGAGGLWTTRIDASQLENALLNLCINGRDAMAPEGGRLTIETANKWLDDRAARHRDLLPGQYVSLCVTDTGTGMTPEVQAQVFDPFFTTKPLGQGTGLGLSMIHGFVRQSGGQVRIYSELGKGTTMCLYLPRYTGEMEIADEEGLAPVLHGGHGETVMVIDDEETVRMLVAEVLGDAGYHVLEAPDGPSGLEILRSDTRIDLLITDVGLPGGMNGRQVADAAREVRPDLKILFVTGYAENAAVGNGHLDPGMEVMTKPFVMAALGDKVREMIER